MFFNKGRPPTQRKPTPKGNWNFWFRSLKRLVVITGKFSKVVSPNFSPALNKWGNKHFLPSKGHFGKKRALETPFSDNLVTKGFRKWDQKEFR
jgi:hypothetical protein